MTDPEILAEAIKQNSWYKTGKFLLSSGKESDFYINLRPCLLSSKHLHLVTTCMVNALVREVQIQRGDLLCGVITSGLIMMGTMLQRLSTSAIDLNGLYVRTEHRMHGTRRNIEGEFKPGQSVILIDDVATTGLSLVKVIEILISEGIPVKAALVVVDRLEGARKRLAQMDIPLFSILTVEDLK